MRRILFLDVDGVVNISRSAETSNFRADGLDLVIRDDLIEALRALSAREGIETAWLTTWLEHPEALGELEAVLGVQFQRPEVRPGSRACWSANWWKLPTLHGHVQDGDTWVWVDDDLEDSTRQMLSDRYPRGYPFRVSGRTGMSPSHLAELVVWLEEQSDDEPLTAAAIYKSFVERVLPHEDLAAALELSVSEVESAVEDAGQGLAHASRTRNSRGPRPDVGTG